MLDLNQMNYDEKAQIIIAASDARDSMAAWWARLSHFTASRLLAIGQVNTDGPKGRHKRGPHGWRFMEPDERRRVREAASELQKMAQQIQAENAEELAQGGAA